ncbi:MAG: ABC transporter permease [Anaerolineales bacterium]|nr:ABC transporter permease [Anaerolineales bacterium]
MAATSTTPARWRFPYRLQVERRLHVPRWLSPVVSVGAIVLALILGAVILELVGGNWLEAYTHIAKASFGDLGVFSDTLVKATPLILTGLACTVAFQMKLWNIGAEGQYVMGALGAAVVVLTPLLPAETSGWIQIPLMIFFGMLFGALWGAIPGLLKARLRVNEIITTLMLNYIAIELVNYFVFAVWSEGGFQQSAPFPKTAWLPRLADYAKAWPVLRGLTTHLGLLLAVAAAVIVWFILYRSLWGYEIRLIGDNARAAEYAGINITRNTVLVMMLSGALAGLAGMSEISGTLHRLQTGLGAGYGFTGVIVAWLAKLNPIVVIPVAVLFGALILAGREIQPSGVPRLIQGIILFLLIASEVLLRYQIRLVRVEAAGARPA